MNKITDALLKAQFLLKDKTELSGVLMLLTKMAETCEGDITPEVQKALDTINRIYKNNLH